ncbi:transcription factor bHLH95-like isoform X2 [Euphorbia lathyris]|uniref:transcription factor bHLH95-like isoform X2 n=1 Tax=Euphorbia lathyris TaxID=212925 RepID=UPI00331383C9
METAAAGEDQMGRKRNRSKGETDEHGLHIFTERERRKRMRTMFTGLHDLLPHLPPKADKSTIVDEAVKCIKDLQETLETLENQKHQKLQGPSIADSEPSVMTSPAEPIESSEPLLSIQETFSNMPTNMPQIQMFPSSPAPACFQTWLSPNVVMNMCGNDAQISVCSVKKPGLLTSMFYILQKHKLDVLSAHVSSDQTRCIYMFHVHCRQEKLLGRDFQWKNYSS